MKQLLIMCLAFTTFISFAQDLPKEKMYEAKKQLRAGNKAYENKNYADAAIAYQKSLAEDGTYYKGAYNLGNSYFNQKKYKEALEQYQLANKLAKNKVNKAKTSELIGDSYKNQKELEKALEAYKQALLKNPKDDILRQKFIAAKQEKQKQDQQKKDNKDDKNKDKKDDKDKKDKGDKDENKDNKGDKNKDNKKGEKDKDKEGDNKDDKGEKKEDEEGKDKKDQNSDQKNGDKGEDKKEQQGQPKKSKLSPQQVQQLLESMSNEEQKTQKKINAQQIKVKTNKNEKDW